MCISIVIVNWNTGKAIHNCIKSICQQYKHEYEVIVVDNASSDGSVEDIQKHFPQVRLIKNQKNLGYSRAANIGILHSRSQFVLLLNPDTILLDGAIQRMYRFILAAENVWMVTCKIMDSNNRVKPSYTIYPSLIHSFLAISGITAVLRHFRILDMLAHLPSFITPRILLRRKNIDSSFEIPIAYGAVLLMKKNLVEKVGFFSEEYFMYGEDLDLSLKIKRAGGRVCYVGTATVVHLGGSIDTGVSSQQVAEEMITQYCESERILWQKNFPSFAALASFTIRLSLECRKWLHHLVPAKIKIKIPLPRNGRI